MKWVDYSKYQGRVGKDKLTRMKADGVVGVCVGSWHGLDANPYAEANLRSARALGLKTATYIVVNNRPGYWTVRQGWEACGVEWDYLSFVAADVEVRGVTPAILGEALATIEAYGGCPCIYTGNWFWNWWKLDLGYVPDFRGWPTWLAYYNGVPDLNVPAADGLGKLVGHQYMGSTPAYGTVVDFNVFDPDWLGESKKGENEMPKFIQYKTAIAVLEGGVKWVLPSRALLMKLYPEHQGKVVQLTAAEWGSIPNAHSGSASGGECRFRLPRVEIK